ncbi:MAG: multiprotein bridging factor aMBF1 [Candidatus Bathyarchaeia archaeon]|nr:multiprotein bridging factor aMBF1 [Candidatus Bathyarchaeia archaeon]MDI6903914.1 multiprotein bridging factor aMBF1 [Candidatus Bathyarchaeia archaeon]
MRCEVCGRKIHGKPCRVIIEGAKLTVCSKCAKHGTAYWEEPKPKTTALEPKTWFPPLKVKSKKPPKTTVDTTLELVENFDVKIRQAREKLGLSHEELGKKISEKVSVLKKIETGKMTPDNKLAVKLEHALTVKLLVPVSEETVQQTKIPKPASHELTLRDIIQLSKKKMEEKK